MMCVLHYSLGLSPYRSGGLTTWSEDLMQKQIKNGIKVLLLYPAEIKLTSKKITIKNDGLHKGIEVFRLVNPLPVPLIYGIDSVKHYLDYDKSADFTDFFNANKIDAIHLHTLMGLPLEFFQQAKKMGIRLIYTAHDIFGIWPEPQLDAKDNKVDAIFNLGYIGNQQKLSYSTIVIIQSMAYKKFKNTKFIRFFKTTTRSAQKLKGIRHSDSVEKTVVCDLKNKQLYDQLRECYKKYINLIDLIHYNSTFIKDVFKAYNITNTSVVIPVYHSHLPIKPTSPNGAKGNTGKKEVKILYNGTREQHKGYYFLLNILDELRHEGVTNFLITTYGSGAPEKSYVKVLDSYSIDSLENVYAGIDVTVVPSLCYETFGMVVAESLSYTVPVILSRSVGAKSLITGHNYGYEFQSRDDLKKCLKNILLHPKIIAEQRKAILESKELTFDSDAVYVDILNLYSKEIQV